MECNAIPRWTRSEFHLQQTTKNEIECHRVSMHDVAKYSKSTLLTTTTMPWHSHTETTCINQKFAFQNDFVIGFYCCVEFYNHNSFATWWFCARIWGVYDFAVYGSRFFGWEWEAKMEFNPFVGRVISRRFILNKFWPFYLHFRWLNLLTGMRKVSSVFWRARTFCD